MPEPFTTKVALTVRDDLATWQKLNVTAYLATGIAASAPEALGEPYEDAAGRRYSRLLGQPMLVFSATRSQLQEAHRATLERGLTAAVYVGAMFSTGNDEASRAALRAEHPEDLDLVGLAVRGDRKGVDKAVKGLSLFK